ncbi:MAG: hypothetical protein ACYDGM_12540, partial [Vulcanimicrobiaceae bacterium]
MNPHELTPEQRDAVRTSFDACLAIVGTAGTGKSTALQARIEYGRSLFPDAHPLIGDATQAICDIAWSVLRAVGSPAQPIDDIEAERIFASAAMPLLSLDWAEFTRLEIDPEVPGLRSPERFLGSAFALIRKLRNAGISPESFLNDALAAATAFYAKPPNFAHPELLYATKDAYRDSLDVSGDELARQHRREIDLAKILAKLYAAYLERLAGSAFLTPTEAIAQALAFLAFNPEIGPRLRATIGFACIDDAQEMASNDLALLRGVFGERLSGVTLAGDASSTLGTFRGARPETVFACATHTIALCFQFRSPLG